MNEPTPTAGQPVADLVPHAGSMCLLDTVSDWTDAQITCTATRHRAADNPLAIDGQLAAVHLCEYGAQAAAAHGALLAKGAPQPGFIAAFRAVELSCDVVPVDAPTLTVTASRLAGSAAAMQYGFAVHAGDAPLAKGRLTVALMQSPPKGAAA